MAFDGIVLSRVTELLNETIVTGRISKLYQISKYELLMTVRAQNENKKLLVSIHPMYARVQLTQLNYPTPDFPNALTMFLRKHIEGSFMERIEQVGLDRILKITLRGRNEFKDLVEYHLYIEIMGKHSNFILTNKEDKILECLKRVSPSDSIRIMQPGITYSYPPLLDKKNPFENRPETTNLVKEFEGFSKDLAEEVASRMEQGEDFKTIMNEIKESKELYITRGDKEKYHVIPLHCFGKKIDQYSLFDGLDAYYQFIDQKDRIKQQTSDILHFIQKEYTKNVNKLDKLEKTLFDSHNSDEYRIKGDLLYATTPMSSNRPAIPIPC